MSDFLTTAEAAARLSVSVRRVQAMIKAGVLKAQKFGHVWMLDASEVERVRATDRPPGRRHK